MKAIYKGHKFSIVWNIINRSTEKPFDFTGLNVSVGLYSDSCRVPLKTYNIENGTITAQIEPNTLPTGVYNLMCRYASKKEQAYCVYRNAFQITSRQYIGTDVETINLTSVVSHIDSVPEEELPKECQIIAEELFGDKFRLPQLTADRAIADEHGNRIPDTYVTRRMVEGHIKQIYNQQFNENPPLIMEGYITPEMLSEETREMLEATGQEITNLPDGEDLQSIHGVLKLANKKHNPNSYSGLGRQYLRKNIVSGVNVLTQSMMQWPNTIYIIQYDYDLQGAEITIPEGCVLDFQGGSLCNGTLEGHNSVINANMTAVFKESLKLSGSWKHEYIHLDLWGAGGNSARDDSAIINMLLRTSYNLQFSKRHYYLYYPLFIDNEFGTKKTINFRGAILNKVTLNGYDYTYTDDYNGKTYNYNEIPSVIIFKPKNDSQGVVSHIVIKDAFIMCSNEYLQYAIHCPNISGCVMSNITCFGTKGILYGGFLNRFEDVAVQNSSGASDLIGIEHIHGNANVFLRCYSANYDIGFKIGRANGLLLANCSVDTASNTSYYIYSSNSVTLSGCASEFPKRCIYVFNSPVTISGDFAIYIDRDDYCFIEASDFAVVTASNCSFRNLSGFAITKTPNEFIANNNSWIETGGMLIVSSRSMKCKSYSGSGSMIRFNQKVLKNDTLNDLSTVPVIPSVLQAEGSSTSDMMSQNAITASISGVRNNVSNLSSLINTAKNNINKNSEDISNIQNDIQNISSGSGVSILQTTGTSRTGVMSQNAVSNIADSIGSMLMIGHLSLDSNQKDFWRTFKAGEKVTLVVSNFETNGTTNKNVNVQALYTDGTSEYICVAYSSGKIITKTLPKDCNRLNITMHLTGDNIISADADYKVIYGSALTPLCIDSSTGELYEITINNGVLGTNKISVL